MRRAKTFGVVDHADEASRNDRPYPWRRHQKFDDGLGLAKLRKFSFGCSDLRVNCVELFEKRLEYGEHIARGPTRFSDKNPDGALGKHDPLLARQPSASGDEVGS